MAPGFKKTKRVNNGTLLLSSRVPQGPATPITTLYILYRRYEKGQGSLLAVRRTRSRLAENSDLELDEPVEQIFGQDPVVILLSVNYPRL